MYILYGIKLRDLAQDIMQFGLQSGDAWLVSVLIQNQLRFADVLFSPSRQMLAK
jgi:hypothetical protein